MDSTDAPHHQDVLAMQKSLDRAFREQLLLLDNRLRIKAASRSFYMAFQVEAEQTLGKRLIDVGSGEWNIPALLTLLNDLPARDGEFNDLEIEHDFPTLGRRTKLLSARRLADDVPEHGMILFSILDITEPKRSQAEADTLLGELSTTLASILDAVIVTDLDGHITFMNTAAEKLTGWDQRSALRQPLTDVLPLVDEESSTGVEDLVARALHDGAVISMTNHTILTARDGSEWPIDYSAAPILDAAGNKIGVVSVFHDITNRRQAEQDLKTSEIRYRRLFEAAHDGILIVDAVTARVVDVNPFMSSLLGRPYQYFLGKELWEIGVFHDADASKTAMLELQRLSRIRYEDLPLLHADGRHIPVEFVSNVYREGRRNVIQCNIRDITDRKRLSHELIDAKKEAEAANNSKSEFLANMSHEIRTPLTAILGFAEMLLQKTPTECAEADCAQIIRRNSQHLLELINDILDLSKVEAGKMTVERIPCDLPALLSELTSLMRPRAVEKGLRFDVTFDGSIPRFVQSDPARLRQILINLLGNAVKFTETGRIEMRIADEGAGRETIQLRIDIIDSGIGLTAEQSGRLFQPFTQADESVTRKFGGTGLGLAISRRLARLLSGDVTVTSQANIGSTFTLTIDGGPSAGAEHFESLTEANLPRIKNESATAQTDLHGRVLLVEDGLDNQRLLRMQLGSAGVSVVTAANGKIAIDFAKTQPFDLILMDMQMPVMDGYAATIELRRSGITIPIIALTAYAMADDRDKCLASGCTDYLSKPVTEQELLHAVAENLRHDGSQIPKDPAVPAIVGSPSVTTAGVPNLVKSSLAGDERMMEIIPGFVARLPGKVREMLSLLDHDDLPALRRMVHDLVGTAGGYGFAFITQPARKVEHSIKASDTREAIASNLDSLLALIRRIDGYKEIEAAATIEEVEKPV